MMKQIPAFFILLFSFSPSFAQQKEPWSFFASVEANQLRTLGGSFSFHPSISKNFSLGGGVDVARVRNLPKYAVPVYIDARFKLPLNQIQPFLFLQGGYTGYTEPRSDGGPGTTRLELQGRSFLGGGAGFSAGKVTAKLKPFLAFKYRVYQFAEVFITPTERPDIRKRSELGQYSFSLGIVF